MADMPPPPDPKPAQEQISEWAKKYRGVRVTLRNPRLIVANQL